MLKWKVTESLGEEILTSSSLFLMRIVSLTIISDGHVIVIVC